jgi:hypothetical protein
MLAGTVCMCAAHLSFPSLEKWEDGEGEKRREERTTIVHGK